MTFSPIYSTVLTPYGQGGISTIEIIGECSLSLVNKIFVGKKEIKKPFKLYYGYVKEKHSLLDEVIARFIPKEKSFCGENCVEICCHGGITATEKIVDLLFKEGAEKIAPDKIIDIAYRNKKIDAIQKEAWTFLPYALTDLAAELLNDQAQGALSNTIKKITKDKIKELLGSSSLGLSLTTPKKIVIVGKTNVGKSTLFNKLVGRERVLVGKSPHTTRDPITELIEINKIPLELVDTAGLENSSNVLEKISMKKTIEKTQSADLVIMLIDATNPQQVTVNVDCPIIICANKIDKVSCCLPKADLHISALKGQGINELRQAIVHILKIDSHYTPNSPCVFTIRQKKLLEDAVGKNENNFTTLQNDMLWGL